MTNIAHLNETERQRYLEKALIIGRDPYLLPSTLFCPLKPAPTVFSQRIHLSCTQYIPIHPRKPKGFQDYRCISICSCRMGELHQDMVSGDKKICMSITGHLSN